MFGYIKLVTQRFGLERPDAGRLCLPLFLNLFPVTVSPFLSHLASVRLCSVLFCLFSLSFYLWGSVLVLFYSFSGLSVPFSLCSW